MKKLESTEEAFYQGKYKSALNDIRILTEDSASKDRLLYLMEAGIILHSMGEYEKSNRAFKEADFIAETIKTSISKQALSFMLSDRKANFKGENFERVLLKFYIALNYIMMGDNEQAKRYFRKLNFDLKEMRYGDQKYKQNVAARYLDAIISESQGYYNDARVQYKNIEKIDPDNQHLLWSRYILAQKESDFDDIQKYSKGKEEIPAYNINMERIPYHPEMGELVIIHQAGKAPIKQSRGRLLDDEAFMVALRISLEVALRAEGAAMSTAAVIAMMTTAENPIPVYNERDRLGARTIGIWLNDKSVGRTEIMNDYKATTIQNYNDNYSALINKNVASIATKIVLAAIASDKISDKLEEKSDSILVSKLVRFGIAAGTGRAVAATVKPDLRCWHLLPSNFQIKRIFLEPGTYQLDFKFPRSDVIKTKTPKKIKINRKQLLFVIFRSFNPE